VKQIHFIAPLALLLACCGSSAELCEDAAPRRDALVGGSSTPGLLGVEALDAIFAITVDGELCAGTRIAPSLILTAAHCGHPTAGIETAAVYIAGQPHPARVFARHPALDLMLLTLDETDPSPVLPVSASPPILGTRIEVVGYGINERGTSGERAMLRASVGRIDKQSFTIDGNGERGACFGDSGAPALVRGPTGTVEVAGVLSRGSATCTGVDEFVRTDRASEWLESHLDPELAQTSSPCGEP
jgi:hypothetical protein